jgi:hypothetical protein
LVVPAAKTTARPRSNGRRDTGTHDFDAEIVAAARTAPTRPKKTPTRVPGVPETSPAEPVADPPGYDLMRLDAWDRRLGTLSWITLVLFGAVAGAALALLPGSGVTRVLVAGVGLLFALAGFVVLRALREVGRAVTGLAARQREMATDLLRSRSR